MAGKTIVDFRRERMRLNRERWNRDFLVNCKNFEVIPKFLRIKNKTIIEKFKRKVISFERNLLNLEIRSKYGIVDRLEKKCYGLLNHMYETYLGEHITNELHKIEIIMEGREEKIIERQNRKIGVLLREKREPMTNLQEPVEFLNLSKKVFNENQKEVLELGPKYVFEEKPNFKRLIPQLEGILRNVEYENRERVRAELVGIVESERVKIRGRQRDSSLEVIREIKEDPSIAVTMSDKSNKIVIMDKVDYNEKLEEEIKKMKCEEVKNNPINRLMEKTKELIKSKDWPDDIKGNLYNKRTAVIPKIFGRIKDHKEGNPVRPIVARCMGTTYQMEKALKNVLQEMLPKSERIITSTEDFINKIKSVKLEENEIMASFDVEALYPSIDVLKVEGIVMREIDEKNTLTNDQKLIIKRTISMIIRNNYFEFDGKIYLQRHGAPIGSPLSGIFAEYIMRPLEERIIEMSGGRIKMWIRYVDDTYVIWKDDQKKIEDFCKEINEVDENIKFTLEKETDGRLNFLDVQLIRSGRDIIRDVYRKPMASRTTIPRSASAPNEYKKSAYRAMLKRAKIVCTRSTYKLELKRIYEIAKKNGYKRTFVDEIRMKMDRRKNEGKKEKINYGGSIDYHGNMTNKIKRVLKKNKIGVGIKTRNKIGRIIMKDREPACKMEKRGVYSIPFTKRDGEEMHYIGYTARKFGKRLKEHKDDLRQLKSTTALARINKREEIEVDFENAGIIANQESDYQNRIRESIEILYGKRRVCNEDTSYIIPRIWTKTLKRRKRKAEDHELDNGGGARMTQQQGEESVDGAGEIEQSDAYERGSQNGDGHV